MARDKTTIQKAREAQTLLDIEKQRAERRMKAGKANPPEHLPEGGKTGDARDKVGEALGVSGKTVVQYHWRTPMPTVPRRRPVLVTPPGQADGSERLPLAELKRRLEELRRRLPPDAYEAVRRVILGQDDPPG